jgi:hypothetical protein
MGPANPEPPAGSRVGLRSTGRPVSRGVGRPAGTPSGYPHGVNRASEVDPGTDTEGPRRGLAQWSREGARRAWPHLAVLLGALLWWPAGFLGIESWLRLPVRPLDGDVLFLGATAAAASVSLLVRSPWPRFLIVLVFSAIGWLLSAPHSDTHPDERQSLAILLGLAAFGGIVLGARGHKGPLGAATVLAIVAGLSPATWPHGIPLAVALALPFAVATWQRVAPTLLSVARTLLTWLVFALAAAALSRGWDVLHPRMSVGSRRGEARLVLDAAWDYVRTHWWQHSQQLLGDYVQWFWVAAALAVVIVTVRALTGGLSRRSAPVHDQSATSGGPRR